MTRTRSWIAGTVVLAVLILVAGWLLLVSPQRSAAAELRAAAVAQRSTNATLQVRLDELVAQSADLPALQARLAAVRSRMPAEAELAELIRELTTSASRAGLNLTGIVPSVPTLVAAPAVAAAPVAGAPAADGPVVAATPGAVAGDQLYAINLALTLTGRYAGVSAYVNQLEELTRAFQVTGFTLGADASAGPVSGAIQLSLQGRVFVLSSVTPEVSVPLVPLVPEAVEPLPSPAPTDTQATAPAVAN